MNPARTDLHRLPAPASTVAAPRVATPLLSVVVVNYRQWKNTSRLLGQLLNSPSVVMGMMEIILVENQARANKERGRWRKRSGVSVRAYRHNRGFAKAVNEGWRLSRGEWVLLLNPDTRVEAGFVERALDAVKRWGCEPRAGIIGCRLLDADGAIQGSAGAEPTLGRLVFGLLRPRAQRKCRPLRAASAVQVPWVTGCGMLVRRECMQDTGCFDPNYFLYYEDVDFCVRARTKGWAVWHDPALVLEHFRPLHRRRVPAHLRLLTRHALLTYAARHWPRWRFQILCTLAAIDARVRILLALRRRQRRAASIYRRLLALIGEFRAGKLGDAYRRVWRIAQQQRRRHDQPRKPR